jgi:catechol 2,3-dioxygenase-like lactoylglutathione lyase family enzyme
MLGTKDATVTLAVKDVKKARKFYEDTLGLKRVDGNNDWVAYKSGNSTIMVYESEFAGTNQATAVTWPVGDELENIVQDLKSKGVTFEHYDLPDTTRKGDIHIAGEMKLAWFKDPDGNIHGMANQ